MIITVKSHHLLIIDAVSTATGTRRRAGQETINERGIIIMIITVNSHHLLIRCCFYSYWY